MPYHFDWVPIWANRDLIVDGFLMTIALSALALCLALIVGVIVGTAGVSPRPALFYVVYPQALRIVTPSLASVFSQLIKDSSLASVITVAELTYEASAIEGQTFRTFEVYITISLLYLALVTLVTWGLLLVPGARQQGAHGFG